MVVTNTWPWYIINERGSKIWWDAFIILVALINVVVLPLEVAFQEQLKRIDEANQGINYE